MNRPAVGVVVLALFLAGCGSASVGGASADPGPAGTATTSPAGGEPPATPTTSAPPSPTASDGTRYAACADGTCEIRVAEGAEGSEVPVPARFGLGPLTVTTISDGTVTMFAPLTQSEFSSDGGCQAAFTGPGEDSSAYAEMTCDEGAAGAVNQMKLRVVDVGDGAAILRIRPAA